MTRQLVLIHGRSQEHKDAKALKAEWLDALGEGLRKNNLTLSARHEALPARSLRSRHSQQDGRAQSHSQPSRHRRLSRRRGRRETHS